MMTTHHLKLRECFGVSVNKQLIYFHFTSFFGLDYFFPFSYKKGTVESPWASVPLGFQPLGGPFGFQVMVQNQSILLFFSPYNQ